MHQFQLKPENEGPIYHADVNEVLAKSLLSGTLCSIQRNLTGPASSLKSRERKTDPIAKPHHRQAKRLTLEETNWICEEKRNNPMVAQRVIAETFELKFGRTITQQGVNKVLLRNELRTDPKKGGPPVPTGLSNM